MSVQQQHARNFSTGAALPKPLVKQHSGALYRQSFGDTEPGTIYRDLMGFRTADGKPSTIQKRWWEQYTEPGVMRDGSSIVQKWDELQRKGFSLEQTYDTIQKNLDTGDWTLPLDVLPEVFTVNPEQTPAWDFISRETTDSDSIAPTPLTGHPEFSWGLEQTGDEAAVGDVEYDYSDVEYATPEFDVVGAGSATRLSDKLILSSRNLRSAESTQEQAFVRGAAQAGERQIILGTDNDSDGFDGFNDLGERNLASDVVDPAGPDPDTVKDYTLDLVDEAQHSGANLADLAVFCDFEWHRELRNAYDDLIRYETAEDLDVGFATFAIEGGIIPVFKSHAITRLGDLGAAATHDQVYVVNMAAVYMAMLKEVTVNPLAKLGPQERFAVDFYGALVDESDGQHIQIGQVETA